MSIKAYLCPNIINFVSVDFSERRPEEVISFFWRSVYYFNHWGTVSKPFIEILNFQSLKNCNKSKM